MFDSIKWIGKLPFLVVFLILTFFVLMSIRFAFKTDLTYEEKSCIVGGGHWSEYLSDCHTGKCGPVSSVIGICGGWSEPGCDCGPDKCWDDYKLRCR